MKSYWRGSQEDKERVSLFASSGPEEALVSACLVAGTIVNRYFYDIFLVESRTGATRMRHAVGGKASGRSSYTSQLT